jgi:hypothetical protein
MGLFQPDTVLAPQFFATLRRQGTSKRGEWQLLIAVLEDAVSCAQKYLLARDSRSRRLYREAYEWIMVGQPQSTVPGGDETARFTFEYICEVLGLDPDYLRQGLERWREAQLAAGIARLRPVAPPSSPRLPSPAPMRYNITIRAGDGIACDRSRVGP